MSLESLLTHSVSFQRKSPTRDASGGAVEGYTAVTGSADIPCLVQASSGTATRTLGQRQVVITHAVYFAADPGWVRGDRIYWAEGPMYFTVHGVEDMGGQARAWRAECTKVEA